MDSLVIKTEQYDPMVNIAAFVGQLAEIFIFRHKNTPIPIGSSQNLRVANSRKRLADSKGVMAFSTQRFRDRTP